MAKPMTYSTTERRFNACIKSKFRYQSVLVALILNIKLIVQATVQIYFSVTYEGGSESSVIGVITLLIYMIGCCVIP